jgi:hypothetical protein
VSKRPSLFLEHSGKPEITRFKDLGEISPKVSAPFIGKEMVLAHGHRVEYAPRAEFGPIFNFQSLIEDYERCCGLGL